MGSFLGLGVVCEVRTSARSNRTLGMENWTNTIDARQLVWLVEVAGALSPRSKRLLYGVREPRRRGRMRFQEERGLDELEFHE